MQGLSFDHEAIVVRKRYVEQALFEYLGFEAGYVRPNIGDDETSMDTVVMHAPEGVPLAGLAQIALMSGNDGTDSDGKRIISQITAYYEKRGNFFVQHIAWRCRDIHALVSAWHNLGVQFLTSDEHGPYILEDTENGRHFLQCFTYPITEGSGTFFELKQIIQPGETALPTSKQFRDRNVEGLWLSLKKRMANDELFSCNIFRERDLEQSLQSRGLLPAS
ncbi:MAG: hypothetical protein G01um101448_170 [Parcubacteria group bacterium Gr01-1014_48]|nr:MAG: hypothetical protein Greene041614_718 [Parcubacteria group bacterium Greene0416_14]TSC74355.1 MAG: hypothetical protein G01um101448_170 [Parcubacteria group bacterium Gr01-1014_48]TSD00728.1 MAG: hypothetical protein Greene101415_728 [Parcubacteria group bacterium Greene1014_15]TSD07850.1 MAG: hypothetical protein Greene07144_654 [Parcubacteria group bacterium Greene0714_4]